MTSIFIKYPLQFIGLVLLQVLVLNNIQFSGIANPYLYIFLVLSLPSTTPKWVVLVLGFLSGHFVDVFSYTPGMHSCATTVLALARILYLPRIVEEDEKKSLFYPSASQFGMKWCFTYTIPLVIIDHTVLFFIEAFTFHHFFYTLLKIVVSSLFTLILLMFTQRLSAGGNRNIRK